MAQCYTCGEKKIQHGNNPSGYNNNSPYALEPVHWKYICNGKNPIEYKTGEPHVCRNPMTPPLAGLVESKFEKKCNRCTQNSKFWVEWDCSHSICKNCFESYYENQKIMCGLIQDPTTEKYTLGCPERGMWNKLSLTNKNKELTGCKTTLLDNNIFRLLGRPKYEKYRKYGEDLAILNMGGVQCPAWECGWTFLPNPNSNGMQQCSSCNITFCAQCKGAVCSCRIGQNNPLHNGRFNNPSQQQQQQQRNNNEFVAGNQSYIQQHQQMPGNNSYQSSPNLLQQEQAQKMAQQEHLQRMAQQQQILLNQQYMPNQIGFPHPGFVAGPTMTTNNLYTPLIYDQNPYLFNQYNALITNYFNHIGMNYMLDQLKQQVNQMCLSNNRPVMSSESTVPQPMPSINNSQQNYTGLKGTYSPNNSSSSSSSSSYSSQRIPFGNNNGTVAPFQNHNGTDSKMNKPSEAPFIKTGAIFERMSMLGPNDWEYFYPKNPSGEEWSIPVQTPNGKSITVTIGCNNHIGYCKNKIFEILLAKNEAGSCKSPMDFEIIVAGSMTRNSDVLKDYKLSQNTCLRVILRPNNNS